MDRTKTKLAAFFNADDDDEAIPIPAKPAVDESKIAQYTQGTVRKSKREKEKEREEAKRKEEEELAAKTYAEFLDAFEGGGSTRQGSAGSGFVKAGAGGSYEPQAGRAPQSQKMGVARAFEDDTTRPVSPPAAPKPKGKRAMDAFLQEIKRDQAEREERLARKSGAQGRSITALAAYEGQSGSRDRGDPLTTNVFVANLPANISEPVLGNFFAQRCGPVGSVKIMWPRGDMSHGPGADMTASRSKKSAGLSGFVSFMKRRDAEIAVREMDGFDWGGSTLRVGWSKAVPIASKAAYVARGRSYSRSRSRSRSYERNSSRRHDRRDYSRGRYNSRSRSPRRKHGRSYSRDRSRSASRTRHRYSRSRSPRRMRAYSASRSRSPYRRSRSPYEHKSRSGVDPETEKFIRTVALKVKDNGEKFEDLLRERERQNSKFTFLFDTSTPENRLYRSIISGESLVYGFDDDGYNSVYSTDSAEESEREVVRKYKLGKLARRRFEAMLRAMSGKRGEVARCMAFSLEHAEAASEVSDIIVASLLVDSTPVPRKVARLHLICDILHNSAATVPSAWKFRQEFQARLGIVFDHLSGIYHSFPGRITAETFKQQIVAVVNVWEDLLVFPLEYTTTLKSRLDGTVIADAKDNVENTDVADEKEDTSTARVSKFKSSSFKPAEIITETSKEVKLVPTEPSRGNVEGEADMDMGDSDEDKKSDVDGEPIDDIDGEPIDGDPIDGEPIDDIDGEPIGEDIDGEPIDDDIDGEPI